MVGNHPLTETPNCLTRALLLRQLAEFHLLLTATGGLFKEPIVALRQLAALILVHLLSVRGELRPGQGHTGGQKRASNHCHCDYFMCSHICFSLTPYLTKPEFGRVSLYLNLPWSRKQAT